jgi:hypothetical protein
MNNTLAQPGHDINHVNREVDRLLEAAPAYRRLDPAARQELKRDVVKIASYLALGEPAVQRPYSAQLAPDLRSALAPRQQPEQQQPQQAPAPGAVSPQPAAAPKPVRPRAGGVACATLNATDFPQFVSSLIQAFQAMSRATFSRWKPTPLLKNVAQNGPLHGR